MAVRSLGFDLVQGKLFGGPMELRKFERTVIGPRGLPARGVN
jgi:EAL domain-containing protein (putative c-di-GMP-specific phosphodiesterase class I)